MPMTQKGKNIEKDQGIIRHPAVAGAFYPSRQNELSEMVDNFLQNANPHETRGMITALIVPHAGYVYSGEVAAFGYKKLIGEDIDTVIIVGNSHSEQFFGASIYPEGFWETPLGKVRVDSFLAKKIMEMDSRIRFRESAHLEEHSLEVQIPFLQKALKNFAIVPIILGNSSKDDYLFLAEAIYKSIQGKNVLLIASSDLSHYPSYEDAETADKKTIDAIASGDCARFEKTINDLEVEGIENALTFACGSDAIKTIMQVAKKLGADEIAVLKSANSSDVSGDKDRVVGYATIGFFAPRRGNLLTADEKKELLQIARTSVENYVKTEKAPDWNEASKKLQEKLGAFVTLKKDGKLRGCIGRFSPTDIPLYKVVSEMAIAAATDDGRFFPVTKDELDGLQYEISVLSESVKVQSYKDIIFGKHGVVVKSGGRSGVFLPQVADETGWNIDEFLSHLCLEKAGLHPFCWKDGSADLYIFTAQVFSK